MARRYSDCWIALVLLLVCGVLLRDLLGTAGSGAFVKTTTLPIALVVTLGLLSVLLLVGGVVRPSLTEADGDPVHLWPVVAMLVWVSLYVASLRWIGYLPASGIFLIGASLLYGSRRWGVIIGLAIFLPLALLLFFEKVMIILLPSAQILG